MTSSSATTPPPPAHESWRVNAWAAFIAGFINDSAFYAIDSYKLLLQATVASSSSSLSSATATTAAATAVATATAAAVRPIPTSALSRAYTNALALKARAAPLFRGAVPVIATGSGPVMGLFFAIYAYTKPQFAEFFRTSPYSPYWTQHNTVPSPTAAGGPANPSSPVRVVTAITAATQEARIEMASAAAASLIAGVPASLLGVPSDVIKKYIILTPPGPPAAATNLAAAASAASTVGASSSQAAPTASAALPRSSPARARSPAATAIRAIVRDHGWGGFFTGWQANLFKDLPLSMFKMAFFEAAAMTLTSSRSLSWYPSWLWAPDASASLQSKGSDASSAAAAAAAEDLGHRRPGLTSAESAVAGLVSGALTVIVTMPLDVINTRMKAPNATEKIAGSMIAAGKDVIRRGGGIRSLWHGTMPRMISFGLGAAVFWTCFAELQKQVRALGVV